MNSFRRPLTGPRVDAWPASASTAAGKPAADSLRADCRPRVRVDAGYSLQWDVLQAVVDGM